MVPKNKPDVEKTVELDDGGKIRPDRFVDDGKGVDIYEPGEEEFNYDDGSDEVFKDD